MVTRRELAWVDFWAKWMARCKILAMEWNPETRRLFVTSKKWKLAANACHLIWQVYIVSFCAMRFRSTMKPKSDGSTSSSGGHGLEMLFKIAYLAILLAEVAIFGMCFAFSVSRSKLTGLLDQLILFSTKPGRETEPTRREAIISLLQRGFMTAASFGVIFFMMFEFASFWRSGSGWTLFWFLKIFVHSICNSMAGITVYGLMQMYLIVFFCTVFDTLPRLDNGTKNLDEGFLKQTLEEYRCLYMICNYFNEAYCKVYVPVVKYIVGMVGLSFVYAAIRSSSRNDTPGLPMMCLFIGFYILTAVILGANAMSNLWLVSTKYLIKIDQRCRQFGGDSSTRKFLVSTVESFLPLRLYVGGIYYMEGEAKLTFMQFLIFALVNLLLLK